MADLAAKKKEWTKCLNKSGEPGACSKFESELRSSAKLANVDVCIDETIKLMRCTSSSKRASGCSDEFLAMRECNRAGGKQLITDHGSFAVAPGAATYFEKSAVGLVSSKPPARTLEGMTNYGKEYAEKMGISPGGVAF
eukprot:gnl/TRDRNA2_/TRDRNA2_180638_c0_seq1.p2 gnl/TRDRNA2_/TRDRNA2_180638_c0~~gnl/TRDRNA2_/TRDRNA2_180638_c0_seq1.p2  ORF type:complete len:139 (+),score=35.95 gnl/TRDRNA2_/TRDRNA2_180638_c0_seq1:76-492(+)